jgi:hypothetical protein
MGNGKADRVNALTSLYAAERADLSTIGNQLTGIASLALTYIIAIFILIGKANPKKFPILWFASPIPVLMFLALFTLFLSLSVARSASCKRLEAQIAAELGITIDIGVSISDRVLDITSATRMHKAVILIAYIPVILGSLALVAYIPIRASYQGTSPWLLGISTTAYAILLLPIAVVWIKRVHVT